MAARAMWAGNLKLDSSSVPVKLYAAVREKDIHFHILDAKSHTRVKQHMINPDTGKEVSTEEIRKGYEVERGTFVVLEPEDLSKLKPKESRDIEIARFVRPDRISHLWFERPYYIGPDGNSKSYFALAEALRKENKEGVARWVMRKKAYVGALRASGEYLVLITLRHAEEVLSADEFPPPGGRDLSKKELDMAEQLVSALEGEFKPEEFRDEYRDRVLSLIESKAKGKKPRLPALRAKKATTSLSDDLARSLVSLKKKHERPRAKRKAGRPQPQVMQAGEGAPIKKKEKKIA